MTAARSASVRAEASLDVLGPLGGQRVEAPLAALLQVLDLALQDPERVVEVLRLLDPELLEAPDDVLAGHLALPLHALQVVDEKEDAVLDRAAALAHRAGGEELVERLLRALGRDGRGAGRRGRGRGLDDPDRAAQERVEARELLLDELFAARELQVDALGGEAKDGLSGGHEHSLRRELAIGTGGGGAENSTGRARR